MTNRIKSKELECDCRCCKLLFEKEKWKDEEDTTYSFSFVSNYLGAKNSRLKKAWKALTGKNVYYAEVLKEQKDKQEIIDFLEEILKIVKED